MNAAKHRCFLHRMALLLYNKAGMDTVHPYRASLDTAYVCHEQEEKYAVR